MKWCHLLAILPFLIFSGCKKEGVTVQEQHETDILSYNLESTPAEITLKKSEHIINLRFPDSVMKADDLIAKFTLSPGSKATVKNVEQVSGVSKNNYTKTFYYTISNSGQSTDWKVTTSNNDYTASLGLGNFLQQTASNNRPYPWYWDQAYTGPYSLVNCGPASVTMVCKWADSTFSKTPEDARQAYRPDGGYWYPDDITFYLRDNKVPNSTLALPTTVGGLTETLKRQVDLHQLVILILQMSSVRYNADMHSHVDRFYNTDPTIGHIIVVKGYKEVDGKMYFESYDPNSWTKTYDDGTLMGKDRYYRAEDLFEATKDYWPKVFLAAKKGNAIIE